MLRLTRSPVLCLLVLLAGACSPHAATWLAGIDRQNYTWEPLPGSIHHKTWQQDVRECALPGVPAEETIASRDAPTIARSEGADAVAACMAEKGYRKVYQPRSTFF